MSSAGEGYKNAITTKRPRDAHSATLPAESYDGRSLESWTTSAWMGRGTPELEPPVWAAATDVVLDTVTKDS
jgi:hypothetical protein